MAKDPAFLFYPNDWMGGTMGMTFEEKGAYMELLILQFNRGHMTSHMIGQTVGQLWDNIKEKFIQDDKGLWFNERLEAEKEKRKTFVNSRKNNIKGKNQYSKKEGHMGGHMTSHMEDEDEDVNEIEIEVRKGGMGEKQKIDYSLVLEKFNHSCQHLPQVKVMTDSRRKSIKARIEEFDLETLFAVFELAGESDMLNGVNDRGWKASLDWILKPANFVKIMEGNYANKPKGKPQGEENNFQRAQRILNEVMQDLQPSKVI